MNNYRIEERGYDKNGNTVFALYKDGRFVVRMGYSKAAQYVMSNGSDSDEWIERHQDGKTVRTTVGIQKAREKSFLSRFSG